MLKKEKNKNGILMNNNIDNYTVNIKLILKVVSLHGYRSIERDKGNSKGNRLNMFKADRAGVRK